MEIINHKGKYYLKIETGYREVLATTDTSLYIHQKETPYLPERVFHLPQPSKQFIEKYIEEYNKGAVITDVLVEYETLYDIELLIDTKDFKRGSYIRGRCSSKKDFSFAKSRFFELHTDGNHYDIASDSNKIRTLNKLYFKDVEFTNIKINPKDHTITIKKLKEVYTKEELCQVLEKYTSFIWSEVGIHYPISLGNDARDKFINNEL